MLPLLAVWAGLYLKKEVIAQADLQPYIQDALNQIEFITGSASTTWGAKRAALGYPNPWKLTYIEIGNEDMYSGGLPSYNSYRFNIFHDAIKAKYPNLIIMGSTPRLTPVRSGAALDYHIYTDPNGLASKYNFFDSYILDHKMLIGEYAVIRGNPGSSLGAANTNGGRALHPFWIGSVAEAVYLLGIEKNSNHVIGSAYAPLFQNMNSYTWTVSYYILKLAGTT
jgi:alpha-L-arabinofuranosidase